MDTPKIIVGNKPLSLQHCIDIARGSYGVAIADAAKQ
jgi:hypothetical protein